ncbi:MAG: L-aspartate oxidase [Clostridiales bacterium]|nr:L-aspartate oxidase [Clostridiales bacterium]
MKYDVIIVGTGAAGLYAAINLPSSVNVLLVSKRELPLSNSSLAQGGVACVLDTEHDSYKLHITDTLIAGKYKNNLSAVEKLVSEGPSDVLKIKELGVDFDLNPDGTMCKTLEAGHSRHRIVHHKDSTGKAIADKLIEVVQTLPNVTICDNALVYSVKKVLNGFYISILKDGKSYHYGCSYCLLATGGIGRVYKYTTNSAIATGDGIAFAHMLGAKISHLSRVQFHPTAFAAEKDRERFLISEAVRGEGAVLLNCEGRRFAFDYDSRGELAPRDVVSDAIIRESVKTGSESFYLDITDKPAGFLKQRFPMIYERCLEEGVDITKDRIPVFPCQHYLMGGISVDLDARTTIDGLYAAGECANTGVHGANRLASNSLLEALVFSRSAAEDITRRIKKYGRRPLGTEPAHRSTNGEPMPHGFRSQIREIMQDAYFVIPKPEKYEESYNRVEEILDKLLNGNYEINSDLVEATSIAIVASIILDEVREGINL